MKEQSHVQRRPLYSRSGKLRRTTEANLIAPLAAVNPYAEPEKPRGPSLSERSRRYWKRAYRRHQGKILVLGSVAMTFVVLGAYDAIKGPNLALTPDEFVEVVNGIVDNKPRPRAQTAIAYDNIIPSVVAISGYDPEAYKKLPPMPPDERPGITYNVIGTGVVVEDDGTILTNLHVATATPRIRVTFMDGTIAEARLIGSQPTNDLAVLQPSKLPPDLKPATMSSAATLSPGDQVVSVGFPFGIGPSTSAGIVSGLGREFEDRGRPTLQNLIQFDASTNPGNSGGPLVNADGEVVGIVTALMNPSGVRTFAGIGFAITIDTAASAIGENPL
jgi:S1-C subfamily serine protease